MPNTAKPARIKELVSIEGVRDNQLIGYGIVVGLAGTGDKRQTFFSAQTLANMLDRLGVQVNPQAMLVRNMAAVMITANLPPFAQPGQRLGAWLAGGDEPGRDLDWVGRLGQGGPGRVLHRRRNTLGECHSDRERNGDPHFHLDEQQGRHVHRPRPPSPVSSSS